MTNKPIYIKGRSAYRTICTASSHGEGEIGDHAAGVSVKLTNVREFILRVGEPGDRSHRREIEAKQCKLMQTSIQDSSALLHFQYENPSLSITLSVSANPLLSKQLTVTNTGSKPIVLFDVVLDSFRVPIGFSLVGGGRGKPALIGENVLATLEFPEAYAIIDGNAVSLEYYPAVVLKPGETFTSEKALLSFTHEPLAEALLRFVQAPDVASPTARERFTAYYCTRGAHELEGPSLELIREQAEHILDLKANWRIPIRFFVIDLVEMSPMALSDDNLFSERDFQALKRKLEAAGIALGLRSRAKYADLFERVIGRWDIKFLEITGCGSSDKYERCNEALRLVPILKELKSAFPDLLVELHGFAESPLWFGQADAVAIISTELSDEPAPSLRESQILQADLKHELFATDEGTLIGYSDSCFWLGKAHWKKSAVMSLMRSGRLYLSGEMQLLEESDKLFLQRMVQVRNAYNKSIGKAKRILGDPSRGEVYGYASIADGKGLAALFNPSWEPRTLSITADDFGCDPGVRNVCVQLFPCTEAWAIPRGGEFHLHIGPWEVRWFEVGPSDEHVELLESRSRRLDTCPIPVTKVELPEGAELRASSKLEDVRIPSGSVLRCRQVIPREWETFPILLGLEGLKGKLYVNNHPYSADEHRGFVLLYPWTPEYGRLLFGRENLFYLARRNDEISAGDSELLMRPLPYFSSSACREDWPHEGGCCMVVVLRYLADGKPFRFSLYPEEAQCAVWLDGVWMEPYRVPPLVPQISSGFSWAVFMLDLEGDWECVRILIPKIADCDYEVRFFLTDRLSAASYARGDS